jgi:TolB-like protein
MSFFRELKRRNVFRVGIAYAVATWLLLQLSDILAPLLNLPEFVQRFVLLLLLIGFIPALIFAWAFEMTPEGLKKEKDVDRDRSIASQTGRKLDRTIIVILSLALGYFAWDKFIADPPIENPEAAVQAESIVKQVEQAQASPESGGKSIAVLPFVNMSTDAENEFFSDGISEEILNVLASIPDLKVAARTSAFAFKGSNTKIAQIAKELGVNHVLEGSVRKSGNQVRVTAQLIKADDGFHLWSENYDRELTNIFTIQDEIADSIAQALQVSLKLASGSAGNLTGTNSIEAYEHYLKGTSLWHLRTVSSLRESIEEFEKAVSLDPEFAKAYAGLALTWSVIDGYVNMDSATVMRNTSQSANMALSIDPDNAEAHAALAQVAQREFRYKEATDLYQRASALNPSFATAHQWLGNSLGEMGDPEAGLVSLQKAWSLDPRSRIIGANLALQLANLDRSQEALDVLSQIMAFAPDFPDTYELLMHFAIIAGDCASALESGNRLAKLLNKPADAIGTYLDLCQTDDTILRASAIETILNWSNSEFSDPNSPSLSYPEELTGLIIELGEFDAAFKLVEKYYTIYPDFGLAYVLRPKRTENGIIFYCDSRVQSIFEQRGIPQVEGEDICK